MIWVWDSKGPDVDKNDYREEKQDGNFVKETVENVGFVVFAAIDAAHVDARYHVVGN